MGVASQIGWWVLRRRDRFRVTGSSMEPTLADGEFVLIDRERRPVPGELALARHPRQDDLLVVKRLAATEPDGRIVLASDNPSAGTDSRHWGPMPPSAVEGTVTLVLSRPLADLSPPSPTPGPDASAPGPSPTPTRRPTPTP